MAKATGPERVREMVEALQKWRRIERISMEQTARIIEQATNPYVRMVMEVIRNDSLMHHRVQTLLLDSLTRADVPLTHEELGEIWSAIEAHEASEKEVIAIGERLRDTAWNPVHKALLEYLVTDEKKHDELLDQLRQIKQGFTRATQ